MLFKRSNCSVSAQRKKMKPNYSAIFKKKTSYRLQDESDRKHPFPIVVQPGSTREKQSKDRIND